MHPRKSAVSHDISHVVQVSLARYYVLGTRQRLPAPALLFHSATENPKPLHICLPVPATVPRVRPLQNPIPSQPLLTHRTFPPIHNHSRLSSFNPEPVDHAIRSVRIHNNTTHTIPGTDPGLVQDCPRAHPSHLFVSLLPRLRPYIRPMLLYRTHWDGEYRGRIHSGATGTQRWISFSSKYWGGK